MIANHIPPGVLNSNLIKAIAATGVIRRTGGGKLAPELSALDLHLSNQGWRLDGSVKQIKGASPRETIPQVCENVGGQKFKLSSNGTELKKGTVYVFRLQEEVDFTHYPWLCAEATGKSSVGRIDVLTRLIADGTSAYDRVIEEYKGPLYVEVVPISFPIKIRPGDSLNQLRISCGPMTPMDKAALVGRRLLFQDPEGEQLANVAQGDGTLSIDLTLSDWGSHKACALELIPRDDFPTLDLVKHKDLKKRIDPLKYFKPVTKVYGGMKVEPGHFYILRSRERLLLPTDIAVTGSAYSEHLGELRIHYAGFAHPWFGSDRKDGRIGAPLIFEVRPHSFPIILRHGEVFARIQFYRMAAAIPDNEKRLATYSNQELSLSGYFAPPK